MVRNQGPQHWHDFYHSKTPLYFELWTIRRLCRAIRCYHESRNSRSITTMKYISYTALRAIKSTDSHNRLHNRCHYSCFKANSHNWKRIKFSVVKWYLFVLLLFEFSFTQWSKIFFIETIMIWHNWLANNSISNISCLLLKKKRLSPMRINENYHRFWSTFFILIQILMIVSVFVCGKN